MKINKNIFYSLFAVLPSMLSGCDGEKDLVIITDDLPIKSSVLYMVGDATPKGWDINSPTPLTQSEDDPFIFTYEGNLNVGEMKLCMATSSWDNPFIRPIIGGTEIGKEPIADAPFKMYAGDPDNKWNIVEAGVYNVRFDLRHRTMSSTYLREPDAPEIVPIETETLYIIGDATPSWWNIDSPTPLEKISEFVFVYEGGLNEGGLQALLTPGDWSPAFILPFKEDSKITKAGVDAEQFNYSINHTNMWQVEESGRYRVTFDLEHWTMSAEYLGGYAPEKLFIVGSATAGGWSLDNATELTAVDGVDGAYTWTGYLSKGTFKANTVKDFGAPFYRPSSPDCEISESGITATDVVYTSDPDDQWNVVTAGNYKIDINIKNLTISAEYLGDPGKRPIVTSTMYILGDASPNSWDINAPTPLEMRSEGVFVYEGHLFAGSLQATIVSGDWNVPFILPLTNGCKITLSGVENDGFDYLVDHTNMWQVEEAGSYRLTFDLNNWTIKAENADIPDIPEPDKLYMIGSATDGSWNLDRATEFTPVAGVDGGYTWTGYLSKGTFKACTIKDFSAPFYRPSSSECYISESGITAADVVYTTSPDDQWNVVTAGNYKIDINIKNLTITAEYLGDPGKRPIVTDALYILGDASPNSWDIGNPVAFEKKSEYVFVYEGVLKTGGLQMCLIPADWGAAFIVPVSNGCKIGKTGVAGNEFDYSTDHTNMWDVETEGRYRLTLDLKEWTVGAEYLGE